MWNAVQCLLHQTNSPFSDWECFLSSAPSYNRTLINTVTGENTFDRFFCFKRSEQLIRPSRSAPWFKADTPAYLRAKHKAPVMPKQIFEVISPHLVRVSFGDVRVDTVPTSDLFRRPPDVDNKGTISQPDDICM